MIWLKKRKLRITQGGGIGGEGVGGHEMKTKFCSPNKRDRWGIGWLFPRQKIIIIIKLKLRKEKQKNKNRKTKIKKQKLGTFLFFGYQHNSSA